MTRVCRAGELGATCPTKGLYVVGTEHTDPETYEPWLSVARPQVLAAMGEPRP